MTKEEFINAFNMGRSYSGMPHGFNDSIKNHWKYKDVEEASRQVNLTIPIISKSFYCWDEDALGKDRRCKKECDSCRELREEEEYVD